jgi:hypothetical protein
MTRQLQIVGGILLVLFIALFANLNYLQVLRADELANDDRNARQLIREYEIRRGLMIAGDGASELARVERTDGALRYLLADLRARRNGAEYLTRQWYLPPQEIPGGAVGGPCRAGLIVLTRYEAGAETEVSQITPAEGAFELAQHALNISMWEDRALPLLADVARRAQSYRLVSGHLGEAVRAIAELAHRTKPD